MINWQELKHIHVIQKLEEILSQWFHTDIFFIDERGQVKNYDFFESPEGSQNGTQKSDKEFKNPLSAALFKSEKGRRVFFQAMEEASDQIFRSEDSHLVLSGPAAFEKIFICRVTVDNEFLGSVVAYSYIEHELTSENIDLIKSTWNSLGLPSEHFTLDKNNFKILTETQRKYFFELVSLVAQEIVTFHTEISKREERISALNSQLENRYSYESMIGKSKPMQELYALLDKIKNSESTVLVQGENGTGKELIARAIHYNSPRKDAQFVTVNCSAFNENLLDSELFGHVKGSFTGAFKDKKGLFESADQGTLFLDEIGDMPLAMQVKLLRVLQEGVLTPVGGVEPKKVDVRVVAATNKDLKERVEDGLFREDLYYRINVIELTVPPLRDRKEDIPILVDHFVNRGCKEKKQPLKSFANRTMEKIFDYAWPGNVRELENEIERLIVLSGEDEKIPSELLSRRIRDAGDHAKIQGVRVAGRLKDSIEELEKAMIRDGLRRTNWNKSRLAKELGISRAGLIMKVEKYHLDKRRVPRASSRAAA